MPYSYERARAALSRLMDAYNISGRKAADMARASPSTVAHFLSGKTRSLGADNYFNLAEALRELTGETIFVSDLLGERIFMTAMGRRIELVRQTLCPDLPARMRLSEADWSTLISQTGTLPEDKARQIIEITGIPRQFIEAGDPTGLGRVQLESLLAASWTQNPSNPGAPPPKPELGANPPRRTATRKRS
ncbi:hypothetical protein [Reyranella sp.]|uniref:hypothetical protein n=1 Tax=Reyranella sp. TaxID=1929291 RepID=UPI003C7CFB7A